MRQCSVKTVPLPAKRRRARLSAPHRRALERTSARLPADVSGIAPYIWGGPLWPIHQFSFFFFFFANVPEHVFH